MGAMGASAGLGAVGNIVGGVAGLLQGNKNAKALRQKGKIALEEGRRKKNARVSSTRTAFAAAGVSVGTSGALDVTLATEEAGELEALVAAQPFFDEADAEKTRGQLALVSGILGGGKSILGGAANKA